MNSKPNSTTISDVAERAGVSIATVSRVLNGSTPVQADKAERVRRAIAELNFVPRPAARTLASRKTNTIGLVFSEIRGVFFPRIHRLMPILQESLSQMSVTSEREPQAVAEDSPLVNV